MNDLRIVLVLIGVLLWVWSVVWAYKDAQRRGKSGLVVALLVALLTWPLGLIIWLVLRPRPVGTNR